ncbi:phosphotransferase [Pseudomonas turukhanskensis]|uniref:Aminoglycoside phosphotransferase n=1 Tax=Pseudomonas turukhanskensis TaxID=1806536 RepID=A0A9W6K632_9PSED|nr:phosphotransferase [Pseudomonas turukhanskensis]GLK88679.1 aminoglycoside phosphotransferase [Pseudomonas turukhanskensis]
MTDSLLAMAAGRPYPQRQGQLPRQLRDITAAWLTRLLQPRYPGIEVLALTTVEIRNGHTTKYRAKLELNEVGRHAGIPEHVCLKSNWSEGFESGDICELEARFYHLARSWNDAPLPATYFTDWDADGGGRGVVLMEDLGVAEGRFGHSTDHLGVDGVAAGLESLATLHAATWGNAQLQRQAWLPVSMDNPVDSNGLLRMYNYIRVNLRRPEYQQLLPTWMYETPELFSHAFDELAAFELEQTSPSCVIHGDSHQGNSFLRADGQRIWLDWQLARRGRPWRDIAYFMIGALTVEERRAEAQRLVQVYREKLVSLGAEGVLDQNAAWEQLRRWPVWGMQTWMSNMDDWGQVGQPMVERFFAAAEDFETIPLLTRGRTPRRNPTLGEGARPLTAAYQHLLER